MFADTHLHLSHVLTGPHQPSPLTKHTISSKKKKTKHTIIKTKTLFRLLNKKFTLDLTNFLFFFLFNGKMRERQRVKLILNATVNKPYPSLPKVAQYIFFSFSFDETVNKPYPNLP